MNELVKTSDYSGEVFLVSVLPGLGKSIMARKHTNIIDYKDWCVVKGCSNYKCGNSEEILADILIIINANVDLLKQECIFILNSAPWEYFDIPELKTGIYIHMDKGNYTAEELSLRSRHDLVIDHYDDIEGWNDDVCRLAKIKPAHMNIHYLLGSGEFISLARLVVFCDYSNSLPDYANFSNNFTDVYAKLKEVNA